MTPTYNEKNIYILWISYVDTYRALQWLADAHLAAAEFFLGTSLTDEQYSAMESIFSFVGLKAYQIYHAYNKGYRARPFASDFEMVGVLLQ